MEKINKSRFQWVGPNLEASEKLAGKSLNFWQDSFGRLLKNKVAVVSGILIILIILGSIFIPLISPFDMREQHYAHINAPIMTRCDTIEGGHYHIFGTDSLGRDTFVRLWEGGQVSLTIAFAAVIINFIIGVIYGGTAGYFGGMIDNIMMRITEIIIGIPYLIIIVLLMLVMEPGVLTIIVAYACVGWTGMARLIRGQVISLKEQEFVIAAKALGGRAPRIIARHLIPNTLSVSIINMTLAIPGAIFTEAWLSYLGLGVPVPNSSWGMLCQSGALAFQLYPEQLLIPAGLLCIVMLSFNLLGDGLRDSFDPKLRR